MRWLFCKNDVRRRHCRRHRSNAGVRCTKPRRQGRRAGVTKLRRAAAAAAADRLAAASSAAYDQNESSALPLPFTIIAYTNIPSPSPLRCRRHCLRRRRRRRWWCARTHAYTLGNVCNNAHNIIVHVHYSEHHHATALVLDVTQRGGGGCVALRNLLLR